MTTFNAALRKPSIALSAATLLAAAVAAVLLTYAAANWAERRAIATVRAEATARLELHATSLDGALEKYRILPALLARRRDVIALLTTPSDIGLREPVARMAELQTAMTGASTVNVLTSSGDVLVSSDPVLADTVIPLATPYMQAALQGRLGRGFAGDGSTGGYTFASPVRAKNQIIGIVTTTVSLDRIEQSWALSPDAIMATDAFGFVYLSNQEDWRFRRIARRGVAEDGGQGLIPVDYREDGTVAISELAHGSYGLVDIAKPMPAIGWTLHLYADLAPARAARTNAAVIAGLASLLALGALWALIERRRRTLRQHRLDRATALRLERRVRDRTAELTRTNTALEREVSERLAAENQLRLAQAELIQAAKLAGLGQMSAMLAHEFNQPLAAIRSLADNAELLIARERTADASDNLRRISALVARLGELSKTLKTFARKPGSSVTDVALEDVVEHAMLLIGPRLKSGQSVVEIDAPAQPVLVRAGQIRLEQVVVNLITNALDAVGPRSDGKVRIGFGRIDGYGTITVTDNGPGIPADERNRVFDPFFTTKDIGEGLGLGLSIVYNIVKDFDGEIAIDDAPEGGARFTVRLPLATAASVAAE